MIGGRRIETEDGSGDEEGPIESREKIEIEKTEQTDEVHVDNGKIDDGFENALREKRRLRPRSLSPPKTVPIIVNDSVVLIEEVKRKGLSPSGIDEGSLEREPDASL